MENLSLKKMADKKTDSLSNGCPSESGNEAPLVGKTESELSSCKLGEESLKSVVSQEARGEKRSSNNDVEKSCGKSNSKKDSTASIESKESRTNSTAAGKTADSQTRSEETGPSNGGTKASGKIETSKDGKSGTPAVPEAKKTGEIESEDAGNKIGESLKSDKATSEVELVDKTVAALKNSSKSSTDPDSGSSPTSASRVNEKVERAEGVDSGSSKKSEDSESAKMSAAVPSEEKVVVVVVDEGGDGIPREKLTPDKEDGKCERDRPPEDRDDVEEEGVEDDDEEEEADVEPEEIENDEGEEVEDEEEDDDEDEDEEDEDENENEQLEQLGIVGPPTAVSELINEEELRCAESVLLTEGGGGAEGTVQDHVAEWVQNSANNKLDEEELLALDEEENDNENQPDNPREKIKPPIGNSRRDKNSDNSNNDNNEKNIEQSATRKSKRVVSNIIKRSIKCLNKMHAMDVSGVSKGADKGIKKTEKIVEKQQQQQQKQQQQQQQQETTEGKVGKEQRRSAVEVEQTSAQRNHRDRRNHQSHPNHRRNGGGEHPELGNAAPREYGVKKEPTSEPETDPELDRDVVPELRKRGSTESSKNLKPKREIKKRRSTDEIQNSNGSSKRACLEQREELISSIVGGEKVTTEELTVRAEQLRAELQALDQLARAKEKEWNEILSMRKLKEEAYLRIERRRQVVGFMEGNGQLNEGSSVVPAASISLEQEWDNAKEKSNSTEATLSDKSITRPQVTSKQSENGQKESSDGQNSENRQIGEGRQGPMVDVRTIIADYRLRHPETVPRRSRRMKNSVNIGLGAGGAVVETGHVGADSRPSSTDSCKSSSNPTDPSNSMSFKDVLVQFAKLSQQQGEAVKTPQNYPDVTLHPVLPSPAAPQTAAIQQSGSLLHGILTKSQSPRPTTFSPTLARLLTAPERERCNPIATSTPQQTTATQHLLQAYQGTNPVSISDLLSSSKARTEITITPVVNAPTVQSHSNNLIHVEDVEEETTVIEERGRSSNARDDSPPRCQGCQDRVAQFVCAGCGNQWYCSRECQVSAWDEHSEVCSG